MKAEGKAEVPVSTTESTYKAVIGEQILADALSDFNDGRSWDKLFLIIDENVEKLHGDHVYSVLASHASEIHTQIIPAGEASKSTDLWKQCLDVLLENGARRNIPVVVVGGGVTGDLGGFVAATALRGMPLIHVPTTLLAMVDSSIGGKTGINHSAGKNLIGAFYQPGLVVADISFLETLPENEWINGLSEILKYAAIRDDSIFDDCSIFLEDEMKNADPEKLILLIRKCISIKADVVKQDEYESGLRAILNFGHTFAHALETECGYSRISHGQAVFLGMLAACKLSSLTGSDLKDQKLDPFRSLYTYAVDRNELAIKKLNRHMMADKKRTGPAIRFVLLESWQHPVLKEVEDEDLIREAWQVAFDEL
jgi:3-dehydroquinate synthase